MYYVCKLCFIANCYYAIAELILEHLSRGLEANFPRVKNYVNALTEVPLK